MTKNSRYIIVFLFTILSFNYAGAMAPACGVGSSSGSNSGLSYSFIFSSEKVAEFMKKHPLISSAVAAALASNYLYPEKRAALEAYIKENRNIVFGGTCLSLALMYYYRDQLFGVDELEDQDDAATQHDSYSQFSKSGVRLFMPGEIKKTFKDVAGLLTAKEDLSDVLEFLKSPQPFIDMGARIPKGVLLTGEPGNGKTLLARALAGEASCPFLYISASEFQEAFVGIGAARIRHLFSVAKKLAPCIIFIDEIDSIAHKRSVTAAGNTSDASQSLNQLLAEMDGFEQSQYPIVIIGATNRYDVLDEAILRPGRFDRKVTVRAPFIKDRRQILECYFNKVLAAPDIDVHKIALGTFGFSSAELEQLVNEAAILAVRQNASCVTMDHVDQARDYMLSGRADADIDRDADELWKTAVHESGHALLMVYQLYSMPLYKVTIVPRGGALGVTYWMQNKEFCNRYEEEMRAHIIVCLGGSVAEEMIYQGRGKGISHDLVMAREMATNMVMKWGMSEEFKDVAFTEFIHSQVHLPNDIATKLQAEVAKIITDCRATAVEILTAHQDKLIELAELLMEKETVFGPEVYKLCGVQEPEIQYSLAS